MLSLEARIHALEVRPRSLGTASTILIGWERDDEIRTVEHGGQVWQRRPGETEAALVRRALAESGRSPIFLWVT